MSRFHVELRRSAQRITVIDHDSTNGTRIGPVLLRSGRVDVTPGTRIELGESEIELADGGITVLAPGPSTFGGVRTRSVAMRQLLARAEHVARSDVSVLLLGESGTGKELLARAIHEASARASEPIVTVDCGALARSLFASELFGHEKGAFTGAERQHRGAFERADGGTLFLDEVGELPMEIQAALLGVLERRSVRRVGGVSEIGVDVRLIAATHRDLHAEVNRGGFRLDLFYRISVVALDVPALRDRIDDLPLLIDGFLEGAEERTAADALYDAETVALLRAHSWPGNVRELRNYVLGTLALGGPPALHHASEECSDFIGGLLDERYADAKRKLVEVFERRYLERLIERSEGNIRRAAREAEMNRAYLMELLRKHGLR